MTVENISTLESRVKKIQSFIDEKTSALIKNHDDFLAKLELNSLRSHFSDLNQQLVVIRANANNELLEMRLYGSQVSNGSIPLSMLAKLADPLQKSISHAVFSIAGGNLRTKLSNKAKGETFASINRNLDLRLVGLGAGSTKLYITGNTKPDLSDTAFLPEAIESILNLLKANEDNFYDFVHHIGPKSAHHVKELVEVLDKEFASVDLTWRMQDSETIQWTGRRDEIIKVRELLDRIGDPTQSTTIVSGEVVLLAKTGRLELVSDNIKFKIKYPAKLFKDVSAKMRIGQNSKVELSVKSFFDSVKQEEIHLYSLNEILA